MPIHTKAIVTHALHTRRLQRIAHRRAIRADELLVRLVASGVCHTDLADFGPLYPRVVGHEGAGYVEAVGAAVSVARPGDPVLLSFAACGACHFCAAGHPASCVDAPGLTVLANWPVYALAEEPAVVVGGCYFGQSSFAHVAIVSQSSVVNAKDLVRSREELMLFAPLGCGFQTGCGTILKVAAATAEDSVAVLGVGGVGLAAIMAAKIVGCKSIVAVDLVESRLELAKSLGATHTFNSKTLSPGRSFVDEVRGCTDGLGSTISLDTTGSLGVITQAIEFTRKRGKIIQVGSAGLEAKLEIPVQSFMASGKQYMGAIQGDSVPSTFIPQLVEWYRQGKFPIDRLITFFPAEQFEKAISEMHAGTAIKPVLVWKD